VKWARERGALRHLFCQARRCQLWPMARPSVPAADPRDLAITRSSWWWRCQGGRGPAKTSKLEEALDTILWATAVGIRTPDPARTSFQIASREPEAALGGRRKASTPPQPCDRLEAGQSENRPPEKGPHHGSKANGTVRQERAISKQIDLGRARSDRGICPEQVEACGWGLIIMDQNSRQGVAATVPATNWNAKIDRGGGKLTITIGPADPQE